MNQFQLCEEMGLEVLGKIGEVATIKASDVEKMLQGGRIGFLDENSRVMFNAFDMRQTSKKEVIVLEIKP